MKLPIINNTIALINNIESELLYGKLANQLQKDFLLIGLEYQFSECKDPQDLLDFLTEIVAMLLQKNFNDFLNLLYRIDISEEKIKSLINSDLLDFESQISFLILKREWQKVWYKTKYQK